MKNTLFIILFFLFAFGKLNANEYRLSKENAIEFVGKEYTHLSLYSWPRTLVNYSVSFDVDICFETELELIDVLNNQPVPFQLSGKKIENGFIRSAMINFFTELPSGGEYSYTLRVKSGKGQQVNIPNPMTLQKGATTWLLSDGTFGVEIPASQTYQTSILPAPILSVINNHRKIGNNKFYTGGLKAISSQTDVIEEGPLFTECKVHYTFENGAAYCARIKMVQGYPFVIYDEQMENISKEENVYIDMEWNQFHPTRRYGNWDRQKDVSVDGGLPIDKPIYTNWYQEDPHWTGMGWIEQPEKEMLYRLLPFGGNSTREQVPAISFWETTPDAGELGVFVYEHNRWNDRQYSIWQPTPDLSVYFRYTNHTLYFNYPLCSGSRSTAISFYSVKEMQPEVETFNQRIDEIAAKGGSDNSKEMGFRYAMMLHRQYALLNLNKVKDWVLEYPANGKHPNSPFEKKEGSSTAEKFYNQITTSAMAYYMTGLNGFPGIHSISHRPIFGMLVQDYLEHYKELTVDQRRTVDALFLISGYVNTLEAMNTIRTSLAGTANMAADGWAVSGQMSFLYPEHPMAKEWADYFAKTLEIYGIFYTRPEVAAYESKAGRWVESLGIYNWAYLRPTSATNLALQLYDGKNRFADEYMAQRGRWMVDMTTAPVYYKQKGETEAHLERCYPPHGAHGGGRIVPRYGLVYQLGDWLKYYDPILAENLYWTGKIGEGVEMKPTHTDWKAVHTNLYKTTTNKGTNPHLRSQKYTGHGIVLRAGVDTSDELSIHLNQIDKGPNYRWGHQGQGNAGGIYFYARGNIYTGHENEAVGDHTQNNLDGVTNFGVMKNGSFTNIGMNELIAPLYDLDVVQFAELRSADGRDKYAWPEYLSRSVMLVGTDYFLIYDQTGTNWRASARFSWFTSADDEYPEIIFFGKKARPDHWIKAETNHSKGFYRDADGSLLTLVSHKKGELQLPNGTLATPQLLSGKSVYEFVPAAPKYPQGVVAVNAPSSNDILFRDGEAISYKTESEGFDGEAGIIRRMKNGELQIALLKGKYIMADGFSIELSQAEGTAIALTKGTNGECKGRFKSDGKATLTLTGTPVGKLFIDGMPVANQLYNILLPEGEHNIEITKVATPMPAVITDTEYKANGVLVYLEIPASAKSARIELSEDNVQTWKSVGTTTGKTFRLPVQKEGKVHIRAVALNGKKEATFAQEYPVYVTNEPPHYPEGLRLYIDTNEVTLSWGKVLGAEKYGVYRRKVGEKEFRKIFEGKTNAYKDKSAIGTVRPFEFPGKLENQQTDYSHITLYEYAVTTINGKGESTLSPIEDTNPASWNNWYPQTELKFKRRSAFWMEPYVYPNMIPDMYYPIKK